MSDREESVARQQHLGELFAALKEVVAGSPRLQEIIRLQEKDNRQVLLNMSSILRMVEQELESDGEQAPAKVYRPKVVSGWMMPEGEALDDSPEQHEVDAESTEMPARKRMNFFDRAFLKSLKISS